MALVQQHINNVQLVDVAVLLEFLADLRTDSGDGEVQRVHSLNLGGLYHLNWRDHVSLNVSRRMLDIESWVLVRRRFCLVDAKGSTTTPGTPGPSKPLMNGHWVMMHR